MSKRCPKCRLINFPENEACARCEALLVEVASLAKSTLPKRSFFSKIIKRTIIFAVVSLSTIFVFYLSMIFTSQPLGAEESQKIRNAIAVLDEKGFSREAFLLTYLTSFRSNDHWLNASVEKENAYAATNFPFEIMTIYPDFFEFSIDDVERAAMLLHEAKHLEGMDEKSAYEYVWKNRKTLGWTDEIYGNSAVWENVRKQTKEFAPELFVCKFNDFADCTQERDSEN